ncbi:UNVERIFIED_CONTAM: hypothetical protein PYX00_009011 [Menopon gallinae]|uniref:THAP-type domain-containing protein n=1 Tax=Menopon gallinae TaxID=328185 RepID=A0AAW2H9M6_9NEOP
MVIVCAAPGCSRKKDNVTTRGSSVQFHRFPLRKPDVLAEWVKAMKTKNFKPNVNSYLCNAHFKDSDYELKPTNAGRHLKPNAVPSIMGGKRLRKARKVRMKKQTESDTDSKGEVEQLETKDEEEVEYFDIDTSKMSASDTKSQLAGILENESKGALQVLVVGEDGRITNSEYVLKKEVDSEEEDGKHEYETVNDIGHKDEFVLMKTDNENSIHGIKSEQLSDLWYGSMKNKLQVAELEEKLMASRRKVRISEMKCKRLEKKLSELKTLLKLLVLKRGKGVKNLSELLEEYGNQSDLKYQIEVKYENDEESNSSQCN